MLSILPERIELDVFTDQFSKDTLLLLDSAFCVDDQEIELCGHGQILLELHALKEAKGFTDI
jgi:hypothetical protein